MSTAPELDDAIADVVGRRRDLTTDERATLAAALRVPCPEVEPELRRKGRWSGCGEPAGAECRNPITGERLHRLLAHNARLKAAGVQLPPTHPSERTGGQKRFSETARGAAQSRAAGRPDWDHEPDR